MSIVGTTFASLVLFSILAVICFFFLVSGYGALRLLRISVNWMAWIIGSAIIAGSIAFSLSLLKMSNFSLDRHVSSLLGGLSFLVAVYSLSQWVTRRWYLLIKKATHAFLARSSRNFLLFLRKQHAFFGWIVLLAAFAHMVYYLPILLTSSPYAIISGFVALGILVVVLLLGMWIWLKVSIRKQAVPKMLRTVHNVLAVVFFIVLVGGHFGAWLLDKATH